MQRDEIILIIYLGKKNPHGFLILICGYELFLGSISDIPCERLLLMV